MKPCRNNINNIELPLLHEEMHSFAPISKYPVEHFKQLFKSQVVQFYPYLIVQNLHNALVPSSK